MGQFIWAPILVVIGTIIVFVIAVAVFPAFGDFLVSFATQVDSWGNDIRGIRS